MGAARNQGCFGGYTEAGLRSVHHLGGGLLLLQPYAGRGDIVESAHLRGLNGVAGIFHGLAGE